MQETILITGCSSGIGLATAQLLQQSGYQVLATARKAADVENLHQQGLKACQLDLDDSASIHAAVDWALAATDGCLDVVFHNGAYGQAGALEDLSREALRQQFETNLFGWHELNTLVLPHMRKQGRGKLIFNSSVLGLVCFPFRGAYNASKFAIEAYADTLRLELHGTDIQVVLVEPGPIRSRFREHAYEAFYRHINPQHSVHQQTYGKMEARLKQPGDTTRFTLGSEAVAAKVLKAIRSRRPRHRYYVTVPTYLFAYLRRILSSRALDALLRKG